MSLLEVDKLKVTFTTRTRSGTSQTLCAVDGVSLSVAHGEWVGLVGESGCGKTTLARAVLGLEPIAAGRVRLAGRNPAACAGRERRALCRTAQMIFQDPFGALNPRFTVGAALAEVLRVHRLVPRDGRAARVAQLLALVGLDPRGAHRYPHEFSGGQRQRLGIARALALEPALIIADEPVSSLDVSVQAQILNLLQDLRQSAGFACLFIAHDLAVVRGMCTRALVMRAGRIVESGPTDVLFTAPTHPYTASLLAAVPDIDRALQQRAQQGRKADSAASAK